MLDLHFHDGEGRQRTPHSPTGWCLPFSDIENLALNRLSGHGYGFWGQTEKCVASSCLLRVLGPLGTCPLCPRSLACNTAESTCFMRQRWPLSCRPIGVKVNFPGRAPGPTRGVPSEGALGTDLHTPLPPDTPGVVKPRASRERWPQAASPIVPIPGLVLAPRSPSLAP